MNDKFENRKTVGILDALGQKVRPEQMQNGDPRVMVLGNVTQFYLNSVNMLIQRSGGVDKSMAECAEEAWAGCRVAFGHLGIALPEPGREEGNS